MNTPAFAPPSIYNIQLTDSASSQEYLGSTLGYIHIRLCAGCTANHYVPLNTVQLDSGMVPVYCDYHHVHYILPSSLTADSIKIALLSH